MTAQTISQDGILNGPVLKQLVKMSAPMALGVFFQFVYYITDTIWISRINLSDPSFVGSVGLMLPLIMTAMAILNGIVIGISSFTALSIGKGNKDVLNDILVSGLFLALVLSAILMIAAYSFTDSLIASLGAVGDYFIHAKEYLVFIIPAAAFMFFFGVFFGLFQGHGMMKTVMYAAGIGTIVNIILNPILIFGLNLNVSGSALATSISQGATLIFIALTYFKQHPYRPQAGKAFHVKLSIIKQIIKIGVPQTLGQIILPVCLMIINNIVFNIDPSAVAAFTIAGRIEQFLYIPVAAINSALIPFIGQNYGSNNYQRIKDVWKSAVLFTTAIFFSLTVILFFTIPYIAAGFSRIESVVRITVLHIRIIELSNVFAIIPWLGQSLFQSIRRPFQAFLIIILKYLVLTIPLILFFVYAMRLNIYGVWIGMALANLIYFAVCFFWTNSVLNKLK